MKSKKKVLASVMAMAMALPIASGNIVADAYVYCENSFNGVMDETCRNFVTEYDIDYNDHSILKYNGTNEVLEIPSTIRIQLVDIVNPSEDPNSPNYIFGNIPIEVIAEDAFKDDTTVKEIILPKIATSYGCDSIHIYGNAFNNSSVRSITINSECYLKEDSLYNCRYLEQLILNADARIWLINLEDSKLGYCVDDNGVEYINEDLQIYYYDDSLTEDLLSYANDLGLKTPILLAEGENPPEIDLSEEVILTNVETTTTEPTETTIEDIATTTESAETTTEVVTTTTESIETTSPKVDDNYDPDYDLNKDGKVNVIDLLLMKKKVLGI